MPYVANIPRGSCKITPLAPGRSVERHPCRFVPGACSRGAGSALPGPLRQAMARSARARSARGRGSGRVPDNRCNRAGLPEMASEPGGHRSRFRIPACAGMVLGNRMGRGGRMEAPGRRYMRLYNITPLLHRGIREWQSPESLARNEAAAWRRSGRDAVGAPLRPALRVRLARCRRPDAQSLRSRLCPGNGKAGCERHRQGDGSPGARGFPGQLPDMPGSCEYRRGAASGARRACRAGAGRIPCGAGATAQPLLLRTSANRAQPGASTAAPGLGDRDRPGTAQVRAVPSRPRPSREKPRFSESNFHASSVPAARGYARARHPRCRARRRPRQQQPAGAPGQARPRGR